MANAVTEKTRGLKFAEQQLLRHGWERGKGLGKEENGITEAIKVKIKSDKGGMGHKQGEQFTFHWWDHVFNNASASLEVESGEDGVKVKKVAGKEEAEGVISNRKPCKAALSKTKLYGRFVKTATLMSGKEHLEKNVSSLEDGSSSDDEDQRLDLSTTSKLSDEDLMKACGGRTAHKGARHGLTMSAKLARLEQQEKEFLAKYGRNSNAVDSFSRTTACCATPCSKREEEAETTEGKVEKAKKRKKRLKENLEEAVAENGNDTAMQQNKRQHSKERCEGEAEIGCVPPRKKHGSDKATLMRNGDVDDSLNGVTLYKKKDCKGQVKEDVVIEENECPENMEDSLAGMEESLLAEEAAVEGDSVCQIKKKKKKKKKITSDFTEQMEDEEKVEEQRPLKMTKDKGMVEDELQDEGTSVKRSKKKKVKEVGH